MLFSLMLAFSYAHELMVSSRFPYGKGYLLISFYKLITAHCAALDNGLAAK
jgi:hypothetical protein